MIKIYILNRDFAGLLKLKEILGKVVNVAILNQNLFSSANKDNKPFIAYHWLIACKVCVYDGDSWSSGIDWGLARNIIISTE